MITLAQQFKAGQPAIRSSDYEDRRVSDNKWILKDLHDSKYFEINCYLDLMRYFTRIKT